MLLIWEDITKENYVLLLKYASKFCDFFTLQNIFNTQEKSTVEEVFSGDLLSKSSRDVIALNERTLEILYCSQSLFAWQFPSFAENLCLFSKGKCWLESIAHEKTCWIYDNSEKTKAFLREMNVEFDEYPPIDDNEVPRLPL